MVLIYENYESIRDTNKTNEAGVLDSNWRNDRYIGIDSAHIAS